MSLIQIDFFEYVDPATSEFIRVTVSLDTETKIITWSGVGGIPSVPITEVQRQRQLYEFIGTYYNDADTQYMNAYARLDFPFANIDASGPEYPDPPQCDLAITLAVVNETSANANNGQVTITGTSTFGPIQYSIDGINYGFANVLTNLAPGNYTIYAKDANACAVTKPFSIEAYNNPIEGGFNGGLPQVEVSAGNISRWNAAYNPVVLNFVNDPDPAKKNFRIEVEITSAQGLITGSWSPDIAGKTRCDISAYLQALVNAMDRYQYDVLNWRDIDRAASYTIRYREVWDGDSSVWYSAPQPLYVTYSAKQLGDKYGGNMAEYVPFASEPNPDLKAKFLTAFKEPTFWYGLPYDNSFILSENVIGTPIKLRTTSLDINRNPIGEASNAFILNNDAGYILSSGLGRLIIQEGALPPVANDGILEQLGINRLGVPGGNPAAGVAYYQRQLYTGSDEAPNFITQPLILEVQRHCNGPYVYLKWLNTLGGWDYWRFGYDNIKQLTTSNDITVDRNVFDWENDETIADVIRKSSIRKISMGVSVNDTKVEGLESLYNGIKAQMLVNANPYKWQTVIVNVGTFQTKKARAAITEFKLTINLPETNIQRQ